MSLHVQHFTGGGPWVRFGTCRCIRHAGTAPSRAPRAYRVSPQVRIATQLGAPVKSEPQVPIDRAQVRGNPAASRFGTQPNFAARCLMYRYRRILVHTQ
jgi:hypothetical protein